MLEKEKNPKNIKFNKEAYKTAHGTMFQGTVEDIFTASMKKCYRNKIQLVLTSPPFHSC